MKPQESYGTEFKGFAPLQRASSIMSSKSNNNNDDDQKASASGIVKPVSKKPMPNMMSMSASDLQKMPSNPF